MKNTILKVAALAIISSMFTGCGEDSSSSTEVLKTDFRKIVFKQGYGNNGHQKTILSEDIIEQAYEVCLEVYNSGYNSIINECNNIYYDERTGKRVFDDFQKTFTVADDYQAIYIAKDKQGNEVGRSNWTPFNVNLFSEVFGEEFIINMGYISFYDYTFINTLKIFCNFQS